MKKKKKVEMAQQLSSLNKIIQYLLNKKFHFVVFQKPSEKDWKILVQSNHPTETAFIFTSFNGKSSIQISGKLYTSFNFNEIFDLENDNICIANNPTSGFYMTQQEYEEYVADIIKQIKLGNFEKVVAARKKKVSRSNLDLVKIFENMCSDYKNALVYLANTDLGLWMGATPELLLEQKKGRINTVALAGTKQITEQRSWLPKEKKEQKIVTDYILRSLKGLKVKDLYCSDAYTIQAGHLEHLKTDIHFESSEIEKILAILHPTPAVCGIPTELSKNYIFQKEQNNRELYSGYLGLKDKESFYYVNLRCMRIFANFVDIYVGAGVTIDSGPTKEWLETEAKSLTTAKYLT